MGKALYYSIGPMLFVQSGFAGNPNVQSAAITSIYRINAGGEQVNSSLGIFDEDSYYSPMPGSSHSTTRTIAGTTDQQLYQTERYGASGSFAYALPVANGKYTVVLHFAEIYWEAVGKRVFDVTMEGVKALDNYDIYKKSAALRPRPRPLLLM